METQAVERNLRRIQARIGQAAARAGRKATDVRLVAVTKQVEADRVRQAIQAGATILGESRLQEALPKIEAIGPCPGVVWHFIGQLQRRKVKAVVGRFAMIHSVDSLALAQEIDRRASAQGIDQVCLLEVNLGAEASKAGFSPEGLLAALPELDRLPAVTIVGLMAVPPLATEAEAARPHFRALRELARAVEQVGPARIRMEELSMGMSQDFEVAIEEGATLVRIGTAIFGARRA